jgi:hypothetical protein
MLPVTVVAVGGKLGPYLRRCCNPEFMKLEPKFRQAPAGSPISATQPAVHNEMAFGQNRQQRQVAQAAWPPIKSTAGEINRIVFLAAAPNLLAES